MADKTPIPQGILERAVAGVKFIFGGKIDSAWMGPGQPVAPQAQEQARGRQMDYPLAINVQRAPRDNEGITFQQMRALADSYDLLRLVIETRKDQMSKMQWSFRMKDEKALPDKRCDELNAFFMFPDQEHDWDTWLRALLEDLFVLDAPTLYPRMNLGGGIYGMELMDGATIKRLLDETGRTPEAPNPAYQQILKGMPAVDYSREELVYKPRNVRTNKVYGYGPVEQIIMTVNIAIRRQLHQLQYYTEGNVPEALIGVPPEWNVDQIKKFQEYWDSVLEGNTAQRRHAKFVPGGMTPTFTQDPKLKDEYDEWLARVVCFAFSVAPTPFIKAVNRATAQTAQDAALTEGLQPVMNWVRNLMDFLAWKYWGYTDICFGWKEDQEPGPLEQAQILQIYTGNKAIMTLDESRERIGLGPATPEQSEELRPPAPELEPPDPDKPPKPGTTDEGGASSKLGKAKRLKAIVPLSRERASVKASISGITALVQPALAKMGKRLAADIAALLPKAEKAITGDERVMALLTQLTFDELEDIAPDLAELLEDMTESGGADALAQVLATVTPDNLKQVNDRAVDYAKDRSAELVTDLSETTREMLRGDVTEALEQGWSNDQLADALSDNYAFSDARAEVVARTETAFADVAGNLEGYKASGVVEEKQWLLSQDNVCDECAALDGTIAPLDDSFPDDGGDGPPLHPNCRCDILPILIEEEDSES